MAFNLEAEGYVVEKAYSAEEALAYDLSEFDLILLDIMMGRSQGCSLCVSCGLIPLRRRCLWIFCTAKDAEDDMIRGLDTGADDYITKPYSLQTVLARIRSVLRRASSSSRDNTSSSSTPMLTVQSMGLQLSRRTHVCMVDGEEVRMPRKEFEILFRLLLDRNRVFSRAELLSEVLPERLWWPIGRWMSTSRGSGRKSAATAAISSHVQDTAMVLWTIRSERFVISMYDDGGGVFRTASGCQAFSSKLK